MKKYKSVFRDYEFIEKSEDKVNIKEGEVLYHWLVVGIEDSSNKIMLIGCSSERLMDKANDSFSSISDVSVFYVDVYGKTTLLNLQKQYNNKELVGVLYYKGKNLNSILKTTYNMLTA